MNSNTINERLIKEKAIMRRLVSTGASLDVIRRQRNKIKDLEQRLCHKV